MHGYALIAALTELTEGTFALNEGAIYPTLHQLESEGAVVSEWETASGRRRRVYRLTTKGRRALGREADDWFSFRAAIDAVLKEVPWSSKSLSTTRSPTRAPR
jgi:DNA-binding PadR family transcriptional regulator